MTRKDLCHRILPALVIATLPVGWVAGAEPATQPAKARIVRIRDVVADLEKREVRLEAKVCLRSGVLEFLLVRTESKEYESILATPAEGSHVHAALLAMGLTPGRSARWGGPSDKPVFLPPVGPELSVALRWKGPDGKEHEADASAWLHQRGTKHAPPNRWIFIGSRLMPDNSYQADGTGEIISLANFASAVIDVPFESTQDNEALEFEANTDVIPPTDTPVQVIIRPLPGAEKSPHATRVMDVDRFGRISHSGRPVAVEDVQNWAAEYVARHEKGFVIVRLDGRALVADEDLVTRELWAGGVREYEIERLPPEGFILPRTPNQTQQALRQWQNDFANYRDLLSDPFEDAQTCIEQVNEDLRRLDATRKMLTDYSEKLRAALDRARTTTQPAQAP